MCLSNVDLQDPVQKWIKSGINVSQLLPSRAASSHSPRRLYRQNVLSMSSHCWRGRRTRRCPIGFQCSRRGTICHKVNSPHSAQVSNVVLSMYVTKVSSQLGPQKLKFPRSSRAGFRAKDVTNPCQQGEPPRDSACFLVKPFGPGLLNSRSAEDAQRIPGGPRCTNLQPLWSGVLTLMRPCFPTWSTGKSWRNPFVSHSANRAPVCHAHVSLTRGFEMKWNETWSVNVNAWTPCGGPVLGAGGEPKENYIYKSVFTNRCTSGHAEVVERVRKCQPCFFVSRAVQPMSQLFVAPKSCDLLIPRVPWPTYLSSSDGWIPSQHPTYPAMFRWSAANFCFKIIRWPAAKHATGVTTPWKNVRRSLTETWWFVRIERFAWKARDHGNEEDLLTLGRQRCKDISSGKAVAIGLSRLMRMIIGCGRYRILCFSRCTLVDRVKSCISFACALKGLPSGRQALTLTLTLTFRSGLGFPPWAGWSMHPSHLWARRLSSTSTVTRPLVCKELLGWACVVMFIFKPTWPRDVTNSSNSRMVSSRPVANPRGHPQTLGPEGRSCHHLHSNHMLLLSHAMRTLQIPRLHRIAWDWARTFVSHLLCFAPARVKVKHYDYDPIGTGGKWRSRGPKIWNKELPSILPKNHLLCNGKNWCVRCDSLSSHFTSGRPRLRDGKLSKFACQPVVQIQCPAIDDQDCSDAILAANWNWRLASCSVHGGIGKSSKATLTLWFIRRIVSDQSSPFTRTQPTIDRNILRCSTLMFSNCTFVGANVCKLKSMAGVTTALRNFKRNFKLTCVFVSMVRCLLNFAQAIVVRWCNSTQPRCFRFPGMCLPRYLWEDPSWRTCTKSCDTSTYIGWSNCFVVNILLLAALSCKPIWCSSHDKVSIISTKAGKERAYNIRSSAYLIFVSRSWWSMAMPWCSHFPFHFRKAHSKAALKSSGLRMSPCLTPRWISKGLPPCTAPLWEE